MKTKLTLTTEEIRITLTPETLGEERILDLMVFRKPEEPNPFYGECIVAGKAEYWGHHTNNRVTKIELIVKSKETA